MLTATSAKKNTDSKFGHKELVWPRAPLPSIAELVPLERLIKQETSGAWCGLRFPRRFVEARRRQRIPAAASIAP